MKIDKIQVLYWVLYPFIIVIIFFSRIIYYLSKLLKILSHLMMFDTSTAKDDIKDFWSYYTNVSDALRR